MALNSRGTIVHEHGKEHVHWMDGKNHGTQALCCAVVDYLVYLRASGRKATTIGSYEESLALLGRKMGADIPLRDVSPTLLNTTVAGLTAIDGQLRKRRSQTTLNRHRSAYRGFFRWAVETKRIPANPARLLGRSNMA
jgi:site-specific recombinase XerD